MRPVAAQTTTVTLTGTVRDASGAAVAGAQVSPASLGGAASPPPVLSNAAGQFTFTLPPTQFDLRASRAGYTQVHVPLADLRGAAGTTVDVTVRLPRNNARLLGTIHNGYPGAPSLYDSASIALFATTDSGRDMAYPPVATVDPPASGAFQLAAAAGTYHSVVAFRGDRENIIRYDAEQQFVLPAGDTRRDFSPAWLRRESDPTCPASPCAVSFTGGNWLPGQPVSLTAGPTEWASAVPAADGTLAASGTVSAPDGQVGLAAWQPAGARLRHAFRREGLSIGAGQAPVSPPDLVVSQPTAPVMVNAPSQQVAGSVAAAALVRVWRDLNGDGLKNDGQSTPVASVQVTSPLSFSLAVPLTQNSVNRFVVTALSQGGYETPPVAVPAITEDSTVPAAAPILNLPPGQTAMKASDPITVSGSSGDAVKLHWAYVVQLNGSTVVARAVLADGVALENGAYSGGFHLTQWCCNSATNGLRLDVDVEDAAGNRATVSSNVLVVDNTPPLAPTVTAPTAAVTVNAATYAVRGTAPAGTLVRAWVDADNDGRKDPGQLPLAQQHLSSRGTSFAFTVPLPPDAALNLVVTAADAAGNESFPANVPTITEDSTAPALPVVTDPVEDRALNAASYTIRGTAQPGSTVRLWRDANDDGLKDAGSTAVRSIVAGTDGAFALTATLTQNAANTFVVTATDAAGNESAPANVPTLLEDSLAPTAAPALSPPVGQTAVKPGDTLRVGGAATGVAELTGATLVLLNGSTVVSSTPLAPGVVALNGGTYAGTVPLGTPPATANRARLDVAVRDAAGNAATLRSNLLTIDRAAPAAPRVTSPTAPRTVTTATTSVGVTAEANALLRLYADADDDGQPDGPTPLLERQLTGGASSATLTVPLQPGANNLVVTATDAAGNPSPPANVPTITRA